MYFFFIYPYFAAWQVKPIDDILSKPIPPPDAKPPTTKPHLSLEDKQRLARMKDQERRMKVEGNIQPLNLAKPVTQSNQSKTKVVDDCSVVFVSFSCVLVSVLLFIF